MATLCVGCFFRRISIGSLDEHANDSNNGRPQRMSFASQVRDEDADVLRDSLGQPAGHPAGPQLVTDAFQNDVFVHGLEHPSPPPFQTVHPTM